MSAQTNRRRVCAFVATGAFVGTSLVGLALGGPAGAAPGYVTTLTVSGDNRDNTIVVSRDAAGTIFVNGQPAHVNGQVATVANVQLVKVFGRGGNDHLSIDTSNGALPQTVLDGGSGNDTLIGGSGNDTLIGGSGNDFVDGKAGADIAELGDGNDTFQWDPGDGSDVVDGGTGHDTMLFNGANAAETFDVSANGSRVRFFRSVANITMDLSSVERLVTTTKGGVDAFTVHDLSGTGVSDVTIDESAAANGVPDGLGDRITVDGTTNSDAIAVTGSAATGVTVAGLPATVHVTGTDSFDGLAVDAADGDDIVTAHGLRAGVVSFTAIGGNGDDVLVGSAGNDVLSGGAGDDVLIGGPGVDQLDGGPGNNVVIQ